MGRRKSDPDYPAFGSIPRLNRDVVMTEKIDGTNGLVSIEIVDIEGETVRSADPNGTTFIGLSETQVYAVRAGSRNRWLDVTSAGDNYGFAKWVRANAESLVADLGPGLHYGEWFGKGIQHGYGLPEKHFALFNSHRWADVEDDFSTPNLTVVPVLWKGNARDLNEWVDNWMHDLEKHGSYFGFPGETNPPAEGVIVYHVASGQYFKATVKNDETPKSLVKDGAAA